MSITPRDFTKRERDILCYCLKRRLKSLKTVNPNFLESTNAWKSEFYYPVLYSKLKLEDNKQKSFTKSERLVIISCLNKEMIENKNKLKLDNMILEELVSLVKKVER